MADPFYEGSDDEEDLMIGIEGPGEDLNKNFEDISSKFPRVMFTPEEKEKLEALEEESHPEGVRKIGELKSLIPKT